MATGVSGSTQHVVIVSTERTYRWTAGGSEYLTAKGLACHLLLQRMFDPLLVANFSLVLFLVKEDSLKRTSILYMN